MDNSTYIFEFILSVFKACFDFLRQLKFLGVPVLWILIAVIASGIMIEYLVNTAKNPFKSDKKGDKEKK